MASVHEPTSVINNNNFEEEADASSEISSKDEYSSNSSVADDSKKISFNDSIISQTSQTSRKENKRNKVRKSNDRSKRHSFIGNIGNMNLNGFFNKKDDKEKEKNKSDGGLKRSLSAVFSKDKDKYNKRNDTSIESEKNHVRSNSVRSNVSDNSKDIKRRSYIFLSDNDEAITFDSKKSRQVSDAEKSSKKGNRLSGYFGNLFPNSPSSKKNSEWEDNFIEPSETSTISPGGNMNFKNKLVHPYSINNNNDNNNNNKNNNNSNNNSNTNSINDDYVDSPQNIIQQQDIDDTNSSSTGQSSIDDKDYNYSSPTTPMTPKLIVTPVEQKDENDYDINNDDVNNDDDVNNNSTVIKKPSSRNVGHLVISTTNIGGVKLGKGPDENHENYDIINNDEQVTKKLQELEETNESLNNAKRQLEAQISEQNIQINKFKSMEQIMQQQMELSKRMTETIQRLESKVSKEDQPNNNVENTIKRLEDKIDQQKHEITDLKSLVDQQLNPQSLFRNISQFLITQRGENENENGIESQIVLPQNRELELIPSQQSQIHLKDTLVTTLVVNPLYTSVSITASILHAVYVRPAVGFYKIVRSAKNNYFY